jgi:pimeloyl-ACP methyl ester carboxylesterase
VRSDGSVFTPFHRGGDGPPLVLIHGFTDTWRSWELVLPTLERSHDVLAPTLPGHAGGPPLPAEIADSVMADAVEQAMDEAGFETAHIAGNSLGGYVALQLAARGRARSVVALAPAGGWMDGDAAYAEMLDLQSSLLELTKAAAPHADVLLSTLEGRRQATQLIATNFEHIPVELLTHQLTGIAACHDGQRMIENARTQDWDLETDAITCPVRIVWGTNDKLLQWPSAAARFRESLPHADWVELEGIGHCPQLDVPVETAQLILGFAG